MRMRQTHGQINAPTLSSLRFLSAVLVASVSLTSKVAFSWPHRCDGNRRSIFGTFGVVPRVIRELRAGNSIRDPDDAEISSITKIPYIEYPEAWKAEEEMVAQNKKVLILMDVFCDYHGQFLAERARQVYGVATIQVLSEYMTGYFIQQQPGNEEDHSMLQDILCKGMPSSREEAQKWSQQIREDGCELVAVICESDPGLSHAEKLGEWLDVTLQNVKSDGTGVVNEARRNKFLMMERLKAAGIPTVQQQLCTTEDEAVAFAERLGLTEGSATSADGETTRVVVKPIRGCASDDVFLCDDVQAVRTAFRRIHGSGLFGSPSKTNDSVLTQEFAVGQEYAIDTVSKDGKMKIAAIWKYDKRPVNGAPFVYYATKLYSEDETSEIGSMIYHYLDDCLKALDIQWGITHSEVIMTTAADGTWSPRLVEVNCRQHNMNFLPLTMGGVGYNVFDMLLAAYLGDDETLNAVGNDQERLEWDLLPDVPTARMNAAMVHLVNTKSGKLLAVNEPALYEIQSMESVYDLEVYRHFLEPGKVIRPTVDIKSDAGWVQLVHPDNDVFERDYQRIIELMPDLFVVDE